MKLQETEMGSNHIDRNAAGKTVPFFVGCVCDAIRWIPRETGAEDGTA